MFLLHVQLYNEHVSFSFVYMYLVVICKYFLLFFVAVLILSSCTTDVIEGCNNLLSYRSNHSIVKLELTLHKFEIGKGISKLNTGLLKNPDYLNMINNIIDEEKLKYAIPIYNYDYIIKTVTS